MEDLHSATKAPPAPSMATKPPNDTSTPSPSTPVSSTLRSLREALGADAQLLDRLPIVAITMIQNKERTCGIQCLPYKIFVGTVKVGGKKENAWAFLSADIRAQIGVPRLLIFSGGQGKPMAMCKSEDLEGEKGGAWSHTFRTVESSVRRSVFIKVNTSALGFAHPVMVSSPSSRPASFSKAHSSRLKHYLRPISSENSKC